MMSQELSSQYDVDEDSQPVLAPGTLKKRSVVVSGHPTSVSLEVAFWDALKEIALKQGNSVSSLIADIDSQRPGNLSSAIRVFVLDTLRRSVAWHNPNGTSASEYHGRANA